MEHDLRDKPLLGSLPQIFDETIVAKWKSEALSATDREGQPVDLTEKMFEYCITELRYKTILFAKTGAVTAYDGDVVKSDTIVPEGLRLALKDAAAPLENVPAAQRDWHPGSDDTVLDLVHPSLFPVIYGTTRILKDSTVGLEDCVAQCGSGTVLGVPLENEALVAGNKQPYVMEDPYGRKFQWLPCDVEFTSNGEDIK